jgi:DNA-binding response OmpR family regulator
MKIVLVDDDPDTNELMEQVGAIEHVETVTFTSSAEALEYLSGNDADVVILDLEMPVIDGLRLAKEIRKNESIHPEKTPVRMVFYTGHEINDTIERVGEKVGVAKRYMIHKPYDLGDLVAELKHDFA